MTQPQEILDQLRHHYPDLTEVGKQVWRAFDRFMERPYAVRYFDFADKLPPTPKALQKYQDDLLGKDYFDPDRDYNLRWNNYLYFVGSAANTDREENRKEIAQIEEDLEYARKRVVAFDQLSELLPAESVGVIHLDRATKDLLSTWQDIFDSHGLGFVLEDSLRPSKIVQLILNGETSVRESVPTSEPIDPSVIHAANDSLGSLKIEGFRGFPNRSQIEFGKVNLIVGPNGVGKTSLLEAIELLYCGATRRSGSIPPKTRITGTFTRSGASLVTKTTTTPKELKSRNLCWYGKHDLKSATVEESFSKFNFLDTDAAVRLSLESDQEAISKELAQLLYGPEAGKALERLGRIQDSLRSELQGLDKQKTRLLEEQSGWKSRIETLKGQGRLSDGIYSEFKNGLEQIGWAEVPKTKEKATAFTTSIMDALTHAQVLEKLTSRSIPRSRTEIERLLGQLDTHINTLGESRTKQDIKNARARALKSEFETEVRRGMGLEILERYLKSGIEGVLRRKSDLGKESNELRRRLQVAQATDPSAVPHDQLGMPLADALAASFKKVEALQSEVQNLQRSIALVEKTQSKQLTLQQRIIDQVLEVIELTNQPDDCPVCRTKFSKGELMRRLKADIVAKATEDLTALRSNLKSVEASALRAFDEQRVLKELNQFASLGDRSNLRIDEAFDELKECRERLKIVDENLGSAIKEISLLEDLGYNEEDLKQAKAIVGIQPIPVDSVSIGNARESIVASTERIRKEQNQVESELKSLVGAIEKIARELNLPASTSTVELAQFLNERQSNCRLALGTMDRLNKYFQKAPSMVMEELVARLTTAQGLLLKMITEAKREESSNQEMNNLTHELKNALVNIENVSTQIERGRTVGRLVDKILFENSEETISREFLHDNIQEIGKTFQRIHSPNEFDLMATERGYEIVRRAGQTKLTGLDEMSTGQRAAFALSLFLVMNARLRKGPKVLMFDDPIAHVDDINVLSFLDHLRDIAIEGTRQIFFATADVKLAELFRHKFSFLGEEGFKVMNLSRQHLSIT